MISILETSEGWALVKTFLSAQEQDLLWELRAEGLPMRAVARRLGRSGGTVSSYVLRCGGVRPAQRQRRPEQLTAAEREEISRGVATRESSRSIARRLSRSPSTISREILRNGGRRNYRATRADQAAWDRARRPKPNKLASNPRLRAIVEEKLTLQWAPQQIAGWLIDTYPDEPEMQVSHETIYLSLFVQARGALKRELTAHLRTGRVMRKAAKATPRGQGRGLIVDAVSISDRPAEVEDRAVPGHWEGDLLAGGGNTHIATLVERRSRFVVLVKVPAKTTEAVVDALRQRVLDLPEDLMRTLTWDRGLELAEHKRFTIDTGVQVYFCDPKSPWQRGSNENTNGLLRQYFPKGMNLGPVTQQQLDEVADRLNGRPRQTPRFKTPSYVLNEALR
jgi:IS30 family transposase